MITISRIPWEQQLFHSPTVLADLKSVGLSEPHADHILVNTLPGVWKLLRKTRGAEVAVLDAVPLLPTLIRRFCNPRVLLSTFGDRHIHVLLERLRIGWVLDAVERIEVLDAKNSDIVKSSSSKIFDRLSGCTKAALHHIPDVFPPLLPKGITYLYQGNLRWDKGVERVIAYPSHSDTLIVVGDGPYRKVLEKKAKAARCPVVFTGFVENPEPFWRACDVVLNARGRTRSNEYCEPGLPLRAAAYGKECVTA